MPLLLEPDQRFKIVLDCDADKPADVRPAFLVLAMSARAAAQYADAYDALMAKSHETASNLNAEVCEQINQRLVGWENMGPHKYGECNLQDLLTSAELWELFRKIMHSRYVQPDEKKSSE